MVSPHDDPLELVPSRHDEWREQFERERERVTDVLESRGLADRLDRIEHVGSTAVPGLPAKDIVDLDIVVEDGAVGAVSTALVSDLGGTRHENSGEWHPVFRATGGQRFNDHVFAASSDGWRVSVATVAALRERPALCEEYTAVKRAATRETDDLESYSRSKSGIVGRILDAARELDIEVEIPESR